jgi:hypothetical protein
MKIQLKDTKSFGEQPVKAAMGDCFVVFLLLPGLVCPGEASQRSITYKAQDEA